jgi:hypothetical protein
MDVSAEPLGIEPQEPIMPAFRRLSVCVAITLALAAASARCPGQEPAPGKEPPRAKDAAGKPATETPKPETTTKAPASGTDAPARKHQERAITSALVWLAHHQMPDGRWSFQEYADRCKDKTCTGPGTVQADAGATALGLLPFLAAGQTHKTRGPYRMNIATAAQWLIRNQEANGNLAKDCPQHMYSHGLATIALSELYGLSGDKNVGIAAQAAVNYIVKAQNENDGGWRYNPGDPGDTSVLGWQVMALKSAQMAGFSVPYKTFKGAKKWLDAAASGPNASRYSYQPGQAATVTMTAVGLLARQHLGANRSDPMMTDGARYLLEHLPDPAQPNLYYWFPATLAMHNVSGRDWDTWNRQVRRVLVETQDRNPDSCAAGSWAPQKDLWGRQGGRLMTTCLAALTLEIYYRYLPLYKGEEAVP